MTGRTDSTTSVACFPRFAIQEVLQACTSNHWTAPPITGLVVLETLKRTMVIIYVVMPSQNFHDKGVLYTLSL